MDPQFLAKLRSFHLEIYLTPIQIIDKFYRDITYKQYTNFELGRGHCEIEIFVACQIFVDPISNKKLEIWNGV